MKLTKGRTGNRLAMTSSSQDVVLPDQGGRRKPPYAGYGNEIILAAVATLAAVALLALAFPPDIGREISFVTPYRPRPEWYFLWIYQAARYFPGAWAFVGLVLLPAALFAGLLLLPAIDADIRRGRARALALGVVTSALLLALSLLALLD